MAARGNRAGPVSSRSALDARAGRSSSAAYRLWTERGFDKGIEETTVEEIAHAAGVTKGTFYFHFAHKEDLLLEVGWGTAEAMFSEATQALATERPVDEVLDALLSSLARRIEAAPHASVERTLTEFYRRPRWGQDASGQRFGFERSYSVVFFHAQEAGQLPSLIDARTLAGMLFSLTTNAIHSWMCGHETDLAGALHIRAAVLLAGVRELGLTDRS